MRPKIWYIELLNSKAEVVFESLPGEKGEMRRIVCKDGKYHTLHQCSTEQVLSKDLWESIETSGSEFNIFAASEDDIPVDLTKSVKKFFRAKKRRST